MDWQNYHGGKNEGETVKVEAAPELTDEQKDALDAEFEDCAEIYLFGDKAKISPFKIDRARRRAAAITKLRVGDREVSGSRDMIEAEAPSSPPTKEQRDFQRGNINLNPTPGPRRISGTDPLRTAVIGEIDNRFKRWTNQEDK